MVHCSRLKPGTTRFVRPSNTVKNRDLGTPLPTDCVGSSSEDLILARQQRREMREKAKIKPHPRRKGRTCSGHKRFPCFSWAVNKRMWDICKERFVFIFFDKLDCFFGELSTKISLFVHGIYLCNNFFISAAVAYSMTSSLSAPWASRRRACSITCARNSSLWSRSAVITGVTCLERSMLR